MTILVDICQSSYLSILHTNVMIMPCLNIEFVAIYEYIYISIDITFFTCIWNLNDILLTREINQNLRFLGAGVKEQVR